MALPTIPEYSASIRSPQLIFPPILQGGHPIEKGSRLVMYAGGFCAVFPFETSTGKYAVRCWHASVADSKLRLKTIAEAIKKIQLPYFVDFEYYERGISTNEGIQPVIVMDWVTADPLKKYLAENITNPQRIRTVAEYFKDMVARLHSVHFSHGDLQHGNIMVRDDGSLILVDYDSMYVPGMEKYTDDVKGLAGYQHEARLRNKFLSEKADYFSELVIYTSLITLAKIPDLWTSLKLEDSDTMIFSGEDIKSRGKAPIFTKLRNDNELKPLVDRLCDFMRRDSIEDLLPLEDVLTTQVDLISDKWKGGNGCNRRHPGHIEDPNQIVKQWKSGNGYNQHDSCKYKEENMADLIAKKFKKFK